MAHQPCGLAQRRVEVRADAAATLPLNGLTAWQSPDALGLRHGATLLVTGAVELAALRGLRAEWFVARDAPDLAAAERAVVPGGVAGALDAAGVGLPALAAVRNAGAFVAVAADAPVGLRGIRSANHWIAADGTALAQLSALAAAGRLTLRVAGALPLGHAQEAHHRVAVGGLRGRLVLTL
ncbi:zinc-binding dehydrogenase [Streptomyces sp. NPDC097640]|uniref:zinc-binding dehydrogenase n=1 Tax=Streptomyces sp. NPDC097640 TaxID=3157229 RepID=UPI003330EBD0